jgi:hypothetical protein
MKQIIDGVWNASPSAILNPLADLAIAWVIAYLVMMVLVIAFFVWTWIKF